MKKMSDYIVHEKGNWYDQHIEHPLKDLVSVLRNNGVNTECSCGHEMYIQCQYILDEQLEELHSMLWCYLSENKLPVDFEITMRHKVVDGHGYTSLDITFPNKKSLKQKMKKIYSKKQ